MAIAIVAMLANNNYAFAQTAPDSLKIVQIRVKGITCNGDMPVIKKKLVHGEGIEEASFTEAKDGAVTFTVHYHTSAITEKEILKIIEAAPSCDNPDLYPYKTKTITENQKGRKK